MLETPLGTLAPEPRERCLHFPTYVIATVAVAITISCCLSMVFITVCVKKSKALVCRNAGSEAISRVTIQCQEIAEPVHTTTDDTGDSVGGMQVEMKNNVAYENVHFTKTSTSSSVNIVITKNEAYALVTTER